MHKTVSEVLKMGYFFILNLVSPQLWRGGYSQWCKSLLSIGGDNLQFYPHFALFSTLGEMNLDQDFFQVSKLSEDQKKGLHQKWNTFFPEFKYRSALKCTPESNYWRGCRKRPYSNCWGGYSQIIGGYIPPSPRVLAPLAIAPLRPWLRYCL